MEKINEQKILSFLFDKVESGDNFEKVEALLQENGFSVDDVAYAKTNFTSIMEKCIDYHGVVKTEINTLNAKAESVKNTSISFDIISGIVYMIGGLFLVGYFQSGGYSEGILFAIFIILFGGYKIYSGSQTS